MPLTARLPKTLASVEIGLQLTRRGHPETCEPLAGDFRAAIGALLERQGRGAIRVLPW